MSIPSLIQRLVFHYINYLQKNIMSTPSLVQRLVYDEYGIPYCTYMTGTELYDVLKDPNKFNALAVDDLRNNSFFASLVGAVITYGLVIPTSVITKLVNNNLTAQLLLVSSYSTIVNNLSNEAIGAIPADIFNTMSASLTRGNMYGSTIRSYTLRVFTSMNIQTTLPRLNASVLSNIKPAVLQQFPPSQVAALSYAQLSALTPTILNTNFVDAINRALVPQLSALSTTWANLFPRLQSITATLNKNNRTVKEGDFVTIILNLSHEVRFNVNGGVPRLRLNNNATANYVYAPELMAVTFSYRVSAGDNIANLRVTGLELNGAIPTRRVDFSNFSSLNFDQNIVVDTIAPSVISIVSNKNLLSATDVAVLTFTLSEAPARDLLISNIARSGGTLSDFTGSGTRYTALFRAASNTTLAVVSVVASSFTDLAGNYNVTAPSASLNMALDTVAPIVTAITSNLSTLGARDTAILTFTLSEASTNFTADDITIVGGTISMFTGVGTSYTAKLTMDVGVSNTTVSTFAAQFTDRAGNINAVSNLSVSVAAAPIHQIGSLYVNDTFIGGGGNDYFEGDNGYSLPMNTSRDYADGGNGNDTLKGGVDSDTLLGGNGNDYLEGGGGSDYLDGGAGDDTLKGGLLSSDTLLGGNGNDYLEDGEGSDYLDGGAGNDALKGGLGSDTLLGGNGSDYLEGGYGSDYLDGGAGDDYIYGDDDARFSNGVGVDTLYGGVGNDTLVAGFGSDYLDGGAGDDYLYGDLKAISADVGNGADTLYGGSGNDVLEGGYLGDYLDGGAGNDYLRGDFRSYGRKIGGADTLDGGVGDDTMIGAAGDDVYIVDSVGDLVIENAETLYELSLGGIDTIRTNLSRFTLVDRVENLVYTGSGNFYGAGNELNNVLQGGAGADALVGDIGDDTLDGGIGNDTLMGGSGNDVYVIDTIADVIIDSAGINTIITSLTSFSLSQSSLLQSNIANLTYSGSANFSGTGDRLNNVLTGNNGNDSFFGLLGDDTLIGGLGRNHLEGGFGNDYYVYDTTSSFGSDVIFDVAGDNDTMVIDGDCSEVQFSAGRDDAGGNTDLVISLGNSSIRISHGLDDARPDLHIENFHLESGTRESSFDSGGAVYSPTPPVSFTLAQIKNMVNNKWNPFSGFGQANVLAALNSITGTTYSNVTAPSGTADYLTLMGFDDAWAAGFTGQGTVVAVLDTGLDLHTTNLTHNLSRYNWNFVADNDNVQDDQGHGTFTGGEIVATSNGTGVGGGAYDAELMVLKVLDAFGSGVSDHIADAIRYAVDHGANVISMSLGGGGGSDAELSAMQYANDHNVIVCVAAGNEYNLTPAYPAYYAKLLALPNCIVVGATQTDTNNQNYLADFSNRAAGAVTPYNYVSAPGVDVLGYWGPNFFSPTSVIQTASGTSMATPLISAAVAVLLSANNTLQLGWTTSQIVQAIVQTATPLSGVQFDAATTASTASTGSGSSTENILHTQVQAALSGLIDGMSNLDSSLVSAAVMPFITAHNNALVQQNPLAMAVLPS